MSFDEKLQQELKLYDKSGTQLTQLAPKSDTEVFVTLTDRKSKVKARILFTAKSGRVQFEITDTSLLMPPSFKGDPVDRSFMKLFQLHAEQSLGLSRILQHCLEAAGALRI